MASRLGQTPIPKLIGYAVPQPMGVNPCYAKKQTLSYKNGYAVPVTVGTPEEQAAAVAALEEQLANWNIPAAPPATTGASAPPALPKFVAFDKKCLRYFGWFGEPVPDSPLESWRARKVCVLYYLEDDTMQITEPAEPNSGLMQGTLVRRHKLPKEGGGVLGIADLAVGGSVKVYGREVHIVDADAFTREFAAGRGIQLAPAQAYPVNPIEEALAAKSKPSGLSRSDPDSPSKFAEALLGREFNSKSLQQFLQHGGEVLRFFLMLEEDGQQGGGRHLFKLHYFVADSTAEIMEVQEPNSGRSGFPTFLKRGPLPKVVVGGALPGQARLAPEDCYRPQDLRVGAQLAVLGRRFLVYDCDDATRRWYQERLGFTAQELAGIDVREPARPAVAPHLPPWNGVGSPEDSMQNCLRLVPIAPKKDHYRWQSLDHVVFRYEAVLEPAEGRRLISIDAGRRFVVSFYLADQTLSVFEPPVPNSGVEGGKFLERGRVYKTADKLAWYTEEDMRVGAVLDLHGRRFRLVAADAYTDQYQRSMQKGTH